MDLKFYNVMQTIQFEDFKNVDLRVAKIIEAEDVSGSEKLVKLKVRVGDEYRQIIAGIKKSYPPEELIGRNIIIVANLAPRTLMGHESNGMLLAAHDEQGIVLLNTDRDIASGSSIS